MERTSMVFYKDWRDAVSQLPAEQRCFVYEAVFDFAFGGIEPKDKIIDAITAMWRKQVCADKESYAARCGRNRENGEKGGRPKKYQDSMEQEDSSEEASKKPRKTQKNMIYDNDICTYSLDTRQLRVCAREEEDEFLNGILERESAVEGFCMTHRITADDFRRLAREVFADWRLTQTGHTDEGDMRRHLINTMRIKIQAERRQKTNGTNDNHSSGIGSREERERQFRQRILGKLNRPCETEHDISGNY